LFEVIEIFFLFSNLGKGMWREVSITVYKLNVSSVARLAGFCSVGKYVLFIEA